MMRNRIITCLTFTAITFFLSACSGFFDKDNTPAPTPLTQFRPEIAPRKMWSTHTGPGIKNDNLKLSPAIADNAIFTANAAGTITSINKITGHTNWHNNLGLPITSGPGVGDGLVVVASRKGRITAINEATGKTVWQRNIPGEALANPAVANGIVVVKTIDGAVRGLAVEDGHQRWSYEQPEPSLLLRGSSSPLIVGNYVIIGFANGNLVKLSLDDGHLVWQQAVAIPQGAFTIQRMIDLDADPIMYNHQLYAATYQGKIASVDFASGSFLWTHDISSYSGMAADAHSIYISDARGYVWSFDARTGVVNWQQKQLAARIVSGPASMGPYLVVGDAEGYLHWLSKQDGRFVAREHIGSPVYASPQVDGNTLYAFTNKGYLAAYILTSRT